MTLHWVGPRTPLTTRRPLLRLTPKGRNGRGDAGGGAAASPGEAPRGGGEGLDARGRPREPGQPPLTSYSRDPGWPGLYLGAGGRAEAGGSREGDLGGHHVVYELACFIMVCSML